MDSDTPPDGTDGPATEPVADPTQAPGPSQDVEATHGVEAVPPTPALGQLPPAPPTRPPRSARRFVPLIAAILVVVLAGAAFAVINNGGGGETATTTLTPASESPPPIVHSPQSLEAKVSTDSVTLTWRPVSDTEGLEHRITRDGVALANVDGSTTRYVDDSVDPGTRYRYTVVTWHDDVASDPATIGVRTEVPRISEARLAGVFNVKLTLESSYGIDGETRHLTAGWRFRPDCATGACRVGWKSINQSLPGIDLTRDGARYTGDGSGFVGITCSGTRTTSSYKVAVKVVRARVIDGEWRAVRIEGTWSYTNVAQLGCRSAGSTYDVGGSLID